MTIRERTLREVRAVIRHAAESWPIVPLTSFRWVSRVAAVETETEKTLTNA